MTTTLQRLRYVFKTERFRSRPAQARAFYWVVLRHWETEICTECGRPVRLVWWCHDDFLWTRITGWAKTPGSKEAAAGCLCIYCFDGMARELCAWIEWAPVNLRHLRHMEDSDG